MNTRLLAAFFVVGAFVITASVYERLPDPMPIHFDLHGNANGWMAKPLGPYLMPLVMAVVAATMGRGARQIIGLASTALLFFANTIMLVVALGRHIAFVPLLFGGLGLFFVVLGNYMGKLRRNHFVGIRTPWTLADEENWLLTHRLGGRVSVVGGFALSLCALAGTDARVLLALTLAIAFIPAVYSYVLSRRLQK